MSSCKFSLYLGKYPEAELLNHLVVLFLIFGETAILFSTVAVLIYIPTNTAQSPLFPASWPTLIISCLFSDNHSNRHEVLPYCSFVFHFLIISDIGHPFM